MLALIFASFSQVKLGTTCHVHCITDIAALMIKNLHEVIIVEDKILAHLLG